MSQFAFLQAEFPEIFGHAARAESLAHADPRGAAFYCRLALETAVGWLYRHDRTLKNPYDPTLAALLAEPSFQALRPTSSTAASAMTSFPTRKRRPGTRSNGTTAAPFRAPSMRRRSTSGCSTPTPSTACSST
jgi:hypothetical protein